MADCNHTPARLPFGCAAQTVCMVRCQPGYNVRMRARMTRREWAAALAVSAASAPAQTVATEPKASSDQMLAQARSGIQRDVDQLRGFALPVNAEPAFIFEP